MSCGPCNDNGNSPPSGFTPGPPSGQQSSFGGQTQIARANCAPQCPQPATSSQIGRTPYTAPWVTSLFGVYAGQLVVRASNALNYLRSGASGWVRYDASTESVQIDNAPPFQSNVPKGTDFGYVAMAIPTPVQVFNEALGTCQTIGTQEMAAQVLGQRGDGQLLLGNPPVQGDLPCSQDADAENQMRFDYMQPVVMESLTTVSNDIGVLVNLPGTRTAGGQTIISTLWGRLRKFVLCKSQWGQITKTAYPTALQAVFVPVPGAPAGDQAFMLTMSSSIPSDPGTQLPASANQNDTVIWNGAQGVNNPNLPANAFAAYPRGQGMFLFQAPITLVAARTTAGTVTVTLPTLPVANAAGAIGILFYFKISSTAATTFKASCGSRTIGYAYADNTAIGETTVYYNPNPFTLSMNIDFVKTGSGAVSCDVSVVGYYL